MTPMPEASTRRVRRADALELAKRKYLSGQRIDIGQIAQELGINRVTLHRWVGTRDALIVDVAWPVTEATLKQEWAKVESLPHPRVPQLVGGMLRATLAQGPVRRFMLDENERAMKLFTLAEFGYQPRLVAMVRDYLEQDIETGRITPRLELDELAFATVRIAESFAYLPTIAGEDADPDAAVRVLEAFLGGPETVD